MEAVFKIEALIWVSFWMAINFSPSVEGLVQNQGVNPRIKKWDTKSILNLHMNYIVHLFSTMWRIKNWPSNSISCSDNALRLLVLVVGILCRGLELKSSFSIWGCVSKGFFWERYILKGQIVFEGYWRLQPCTLHGSWDLHNFTFGPKYDMDAYVATLFGGEAWDLWWEPGRAKSYIDHPNERGRHQFPKHIIFSQISKLMRAEIFIEWH
jgi:hypothetical protein